MQMLPRNASVAGIAALLAMSFSALAAQSPAGSSGSAIAAGDKVHCYGVNECKGHNDCKTAEHECKGHGSCKGQGFKATSAKACFDMKGVIADIGAK